MYTYMAMRFTTRFSEIEWPLYLYLSNPHLPLSASPLLPPLFDETRIVAHDRLLS